MHLASIVLFILGGVLISLCVMIGFTLWWCTNHAEDVTHSVIIERVCAQGNVKDVALALIGAVSALAGAIALKTKT